MVFKQKSTVSSSSDSEEHEVFTQVLRTEKDPNEEVDSTVEGQKSPSKKKSVSVNSIFTTEELTPDDEVFTFQCPETFNKQNLCDKKMDFSELGSTITIENEVYELEFVNSEKKSICLAIPKDKLGNSLVNLPLKGHLVIKKVVDTPIKESEDEDSHTCDKHTIVFPNNIKVRHPLLGIDWKEHINLANKAKRRKKPNIKESDIDNSLKIKKDKKKLKEDKDEVEEIVKKKKKKKTHDSLV